MTDLKKLDAIESLLKIVELNTEEIEKIYELLNESDLEIMDATIQKFVNNSEECLEENLVLEWLKTIFQNSPKKYTLLQNIVTKNPELFDKIQEIFMDKLIDY